MSTDAIPLPSDRIGFGGVLALERVMELDSVISVRLYAMFMKGKNLGGHFLPSGSQMPRALALSGDHCALKIFSAKCMCPA